MKDEKKTIFTVVAVFAVILAVMIALVPIQRKNDFNAKWGKLAELSETNEKARFITENEELYTQEVLDLFYSDNNELDFVWGYPFHKNDYSKMTFTDEELQSEKAPALYMSDPRWAYEDNFNVKYNGCAAVSITMANLCLKHNSDVDPVKVMRYAEQMDYIGTWGGIKDKDTSALCEELGLNVSVISLCENKKKVANADPELMRSLLDSGHVLMAGMVGETFGMHAIIIRGYDGDSFLINDPDSVSHTEKPWTIEELDPEMMFLYDLSA